MNQLELEYTGEKLSIQVPTKKLSFFNLCVLNRVFSIELNHFGMGGSIYP